MRVYELWCVNQTNSFLHHIRAVDEAEAKKETAQMYPDVEILGIRVRRELRPEEIKVEQAKRAQRAKDEAAAQKERERIDALDAQAANQEG